MKRAWPSRSGKRVPLWIPYLKSDLWNGLLSERGIASLFTEIYRLAGRGGPWSLVHGEHPGLRGYPHGHVIRGEYIDPFASSLMGS